MEKESKASLIVTIVGVALIGGLVFVLYPTNFSTNSNNNSASTTASTTSDDNNNIIHIPISAPPHNDIGDSS